MTTKFCTIESCLTYAASLAGDTKENAFTAWINRTEIHVGWPHNVSVKKFVLVDDQAFAIEAFRDGYALWEVRPNSIMVRF